MSGFIVVGVSGSEHSHPAVDWAVERALAYGSRVELVHAVDVGVVFAGTAVAADAIVAGEEQVTRLAARLSSQHPELTVTGSVAVGRPDDVLIEQATGAELLVVGSHAARFGDIVELYSRRATRIAAAADCSVVVVPPSSGGGPRQGVVVGVDGSELSLRALRFGAEEASRLREPLTAVYAWAWPWPWGLDTVPSREVAGPEEELVLAESLAGIVEDFPDLEIRRRIPRESPVDALHRFATEARLLAVGSHGRNAVERFWLGSVSTDLLLRMPGPVAIVR